MRPCIYSINNNKWKISTTLNIKEKYFLIAQENTYKLIRVEQRLPTEKFHFEHNNNCYYIVEVITDGANDFKQIEKYELDYRQGKFLEKYDSLFQMNLLCFKRIFFCKRVTNFYRKRSGEVLKKYQLKLKKFYLCVRNNYFIYNDTPFRVVFIAEECLWQENLTINFQFVPFKIQKKRNFPLRELYIAFDCETIFIEKFGKHCCYILCATVFEAPLISKSYSLTCNFEKSFTFLNKEIFDGNDRDCGKQFVSFLKDCFQSMKSEGACEQETSIPFVFKLFGFNNHNFDNNFILSSLRTIPNIRTSFSQRFNKVTSCKFFHKDFTIEVLDIIKFLPDCTLDKACKDYSIDTSKFPFDIVAYNNLSKSQQCIVQEIELIDLEPICKAPQESLAMFIVEDRIRLFDLCVFYCETDVKATIGLFLKLYKTMINVVDEIEEKCKIELPSENFLSYISIPQLSFAIFKSISYNNSLLKLVFLKEEFYQFILQSYFGGRTDFAFLGEYKAVGDIDYYDVTSEYPLAMTGYYPVFYKNEKNLTTGQEIDCEELNAEIKNKMLVRQALLENRQLHYKDRRWLRLSFKAILFCDVYTPEDMNNFIQFAPIATRTYNNNYNQSKLAYTNSNQTNRVLNSSQIEAYIFAGWRVHVKEHKCNMIFLNTDQIFKKFIEIIGEMKTQAKHTNKAKCNMMKLIMNSCAGKLAQKQINVYTNQTCQSSENKLHVLLNEKVKEVDWDASMHYLASFILADANFILFSTMYLLNLGYIYERVPLEKRVGSILYCDTDSIMFDNAKINKEYYEFVIDEKLGEYDIDTHSYKATWKKEHKDETIKKIICLSKKCYALYNEKDENLDLKLKGTHKKIVYEIFDYATLKRICDSQTKSIQISTMLKRDTLLENSANLQSNKDIKKIFVDTMVKKSVQLEKNYKEIKCECDKVYEKNKENINRSANEQCGCNNFLIFCSS